MERFAGRFSLLRPLGRGGMGQVWLALDLTSGGECALKRIGVRLPRSERDSLQREFELLTRVRHPAVVSVFELGFAPDGTPYYTMEYVPGRPADAALAELDWPAFYAVAARVTDGLEALHAAGIVHGDVKPSNLLVLPIPPTGGLPAGVRLLDFGLSARLDRERRGHRGTPGFAAPEVVRGEPLSVLSDLYSLGATLFVLAAGLARAAQGVRASSVRPPQDGAAAALALEGLPVSSPLAKLILRLLAADPGSRPTGAREVRRELARQHPAARRTLSERLQAEQLIGRAPEFARFERWLTKGSESVPLLLLMGDSGVGKSTLLRELAARVSLAGGTVVALSGSARAGAGEVARTLMHRLAVAVGAVAPASDVVRRLQDATPLREADLAQMADSAIAWGEALLERGAPPLILIDDHEQLDPVSRAFARRLVVSERGGALRWVWASASTFQVGSFEADVLVEAGVAEQVRLERLDRDMSDRLLAARLQEPAPAELAEAVWRQSGGHPGLIVESLRVAAEAGVVREGDSGLTLDRALLERLSLPANFAAAFERRLAELEPGPSAAAKALAIWDATATLEDVAALDPSCDLAALEALVASGLAVRSSDARFALDPPALVRAVAQSVPEGDRERLHRTALTRPGLSHEQRFQHLRGAGDARAALVEAEAVLAVRPDLLLAVEATAVAALLGPAVASAWEGRAGQLLLQRGRYREAMPHLERAVALAPDDEQRASWLLALSSTYLRTGAMQALDQLVTKALAGALPDRVRAMLNVNRAAARLIKGDSEDSLALAREALELAERSADGEAEGLALLHMGAVVLRRDDGAALALELADRAAAACARSGHDLGRMRAASLKASALLAGQRHEDAERICRAALAEARSHDLRLAQYELSTWLVMLLVEEGRWNEARAPLAEAMRIALEESWPGMAAFCAMNGSILDSLTGNPARVLGRSRALLRSVRRHQHSLEGATLRGIAHACRTTGRLRASARASRSAIRVADASGLQYENQWTRIEYGRLLARTSRWAEARETWEAGLDGHVNVESVPAAILTLLVGRAALRARDTAGAQNRLDAAERWLHGRQAAYAGAHVLQLRAELLVVAGDAEAAAAAMNEMERAYASLPAPADAAAALLDLARIASQTGIAARLPLGEWLQRAADGFERVADRAGRSQALALAVDWYRRYSVSTSKPARERDLLQAVARLLDSMSDLGQLSREAMRLAVEQLDAERGVLLLADRESGELRAVVEHGAIDVETRDQALSYSRRVVEQVTSSGGPVLFGDAVTESDLLSQSMVELGLRSVLCVPLFIEAKVVGAVYLDDSRRPETFGKAERSLLEGFSHLLAVAIDKGRGHEQVQRENEQLLGENLSLRREASVKFRPHNFIGASHAMQRVLATVERAAAMPTTVLITGENGTGKELVARMLHHGGPRGLKPFVEVNCGALSPHLIESELFGILQDVATGVRARAGRFLEARGGTLFLDEIGEMPLAQQVALLRVLSERKVIPVGGGRAVEVDVRVIAATNCDLEARVAAGTFREDLWYRLNVIRIEVPPLRERKADIPALAHHFTAAFAVQQNRAVPALSPALIATLMQGDWPGNVRELQNYIERLMVMTSGVVLTPSPLPHETSFRGAVAQRTERGRPLEQLVAELELRCLRDALDRHAGNQTSAALDLGLTEQSMRYRLRKYDLRKGRRIRRIR